MRRVNVHLDADLDADLTREAVRTGESRASLLRRAARLFLDQRSRDDSAGWDQFTGAVADALPGTADAHDDDVIYR